MRSAKPLAVAPAREMLYELIATVLDGKYLGRLKRLDKSIGNPDCRAVPHPALCTGTDFHWDVIIGHAVRLPLSGSACRRMPASRRRSSIRQHFRRQMPSYRHLISVVLASKKIQPVLQNKYLSASDDVVLHEKITERSAENWR
jgi:hypothetical protein